MTRIGSHCSYPLPFLLLHIILISLSTVLSYSILIITSKRIFQHVIYSIPLYGNINCLATFPSSPIYPITTISAWLSSITSLAVQPNPNSPLLSLHPNPPAWPLRLTSPTGLLSPPFREPPSETRWKARRRMCRVGATLVGPPFSFSPSFSFLSLSPCLPFTPLTSLFPSPSPHWPYLHPFLSHAFIWGLDLQCPWIQIGIDVNSHYWCHAFSWIHKLLLCLLAYTLTCILPFFLPAFLLISPFHTLHALSFIHWIPLEYQFYTLAVP